MILSRVIEHVKAQNWFAVFLDFVIVVMGVFIGLQVSNWNAARADARRGAVFSERLRADLAIEAWNFDVLASYLEDVEANAKAALDIIEGRREAANEDLVIHAYRATQYASSIRRRATWDELTSAGALGLIADQKLRDVAALVYNSESQRQAREEGEDSRYRTLFRMIVPVSVQATLEEQCGDRYTAPGDYGAMKNQLNYPCETGLSREKIDAVAASLRADPDLVRALRLRAVDVRTQIGNLTTSNEDVITGLRDLAGERAP